MTILLAAIGCLIVLFARPIYGLAVYCVLSMWYPYSVATLKVGTIDFSVGRIVITVLFLKLFFSTDLAAKFKSVWLDRLVVILFAAEIAAGLTTTESMKLIEYRSGDFFDMALPYFAVRLIVTDRKRFVSLLKAIAWSSAGLALFSCYESITGQNLLDLGRRLPPPEVRLNYFHRAQTTFRHAIYYGVFSGMVGTLCMALARVKDRRQTLHKILAVVLFSGAFFSMSSGGLLAIFGGVGFILCYRFRKQWKTGLAAVIIMCVAVEFISNRHFYDVIDRFAFNAQTAWYRTRLFEVAFFEGGMSGHWIFGYGMTDPMWCLKIDMRNHTDMVNHYLLKLARYGLVGFIPFCAVMIAAIKSLFTGFWSIKQDTDQWFVWCIAGSLFSVLLAMNSVSLFGQPMIVFFIVLGLCVAVPDMIRRSEDMEQPKIEGPE